jgi:hypothetical protein
MNNVITLVAWHDSRVSVTHDPHVTVSFYMVVKHVGCSHKWEKSEIYVPVMKHFVNSIPEHVRPPESYHSMIHINFILTSSAYSRDLRFSQW